MLQEYSYIYSIPYCIIFGILCYFYWKEQRQDATAGRKSFFFLLIFIGLRGFVASDYISYYPFFQDLPIIFDLHFASLYSNGFEFGFVFYSSLIKTIFPNYHCWVFINTLVDLIICYWVFRRYSSSIVLSFIVFFAIQGLALEFNLYRNVKAIDCFLLSLPYLKERKVCPYFALNLLGTTFHLTSFLYLPMYFVLTRQIPGIFIWGAFIAANLMMFMNISITGQLVEFLIPLMGIEQMTNKLIGYYENNIEAYGLSIGYIERTFAFILFTLMRKRLLDQQAYNRIFYNCYFLYYITFHLFYDVEVFVDRIPTLFAFSYWLLYPNTFALVQKKLNRQLLLGFLLLLCLLKTISYSSSVMNMYDNLLWGIRSFEERTQIFYRFM